MPEPTFAFQDLLQRAFNGDQAAVTDIYKTYRIPMLKVIRATLDKRLRRVFDSDDFVQDAFHTAFGGKLYAENFTSPGAFVAWLQKVTENKVRDAAEKHLRSQRSAFGHEVALDADAARASTCKPVPVEPPFEEGDTCARLRSGLAQLPEIERTAMELRLDGRSPPEIATHLHIGAQETYRLLEMPGNESAYTLLSG